MMVAREVRLTIDDERCRVCRRCPAAEACRVRAIVRLDPEDAPYLDVTRCYDCRLCLPACPARAVRLLDSGAGAAGRS